MPGRRPSWRNGASRRPGEGSTEAQEAATAAARLDGTIGRLRREMKLPGAMIMHWLEEISKSPNAPFSCF